MSVKEYFLLLRPLNCLIAGIAAIIGYWIAAGSILLNTQALIAFLAVFLICGAGQAINDYFDLEIDRKKKSKKALALGKIKAHDAFAFSVVLALVGIILSLFLGTLNFMIALFMSLLLFGYSAFPKLKILGNWISVALGTAITLIFGAAIIGDFRIVAWLFVPMFLANCARELIKDLEDLKIDKGVKKTVPMIIGEKNSKSLAGIYYTLAIIVGFYVFGFGIIKSYYYLLFIFLASLIFFYSAFLTGRGNFSKAQKISKAGMLLALIAYFAILF